MHRWSRMAVVLGLGACAEGPSTTAPEASPRPPVVQLGPEGVSVPVGASVQLSVAAINARVTGWTWTTSDAGRATVSTAGAVEGVSPGAVAVRACVMNLPALCGQITVFVVPVPGQGLHGVVVQPGGRDGRFGGRSASVGARVAGSAALTMR